MLGERSLGWLAIAVCSIAACGPADGDPEPLVPGAVHRFETVGEERWHWVESGSGPALVVLHGFPESWYAWSELVETMASDFRVLAIDLKGAGLSSTSDGDYSVAAMANELAALLEQIGVDRFYLAGHDWGGLVGARLAGEHPQRVIAYAHVSAPVERYDLSRMPDLRDLHNRSRIGDRPDVERRAVRKADARSHRGGRSRGTLSTARTAPYRLLRSGRRPRRNGALFP